MKIDYIFYCFIKKLTWFWDKNVNYLMITNPMVPTSRPEFFIASGIANIPVPMLPFNKWIIASQLLKKVNKIFQKPYPQVLLTLVLAWVLHHYWKLSNKVLYEIFPQGALNYQKSNSKCPKIPLLFSKFGSLNLKLLIFMRHKYRYW